MVHWYTTSCSSPAISVRMWSDNIYYTIETGDSAYLQYFPHSFVQPSSFRKPPQCGKLKRRRGRRLRRVLLRMVVGACSQVAENHPFTQIGDFTADYTSAGDKWLNWYEMGHWYVQIASCGRMSGTRTRNPSKLTYIVHEEWTSLLLILLPPN